MSVKQSSALLLMVIDGCASYYILKSGADQVPWCYWEYTSSHDPVSVA